jgi:ATP-binding cassette subfamily B protein
MTSPFQIMHSMTSDRSALNGKAISKQTRARVFGFAKPYKGPILGFLGTIIAATFLGLLPPLLIREVFDDAIINSDGGYINVLFLVMIAAALGEAVLGLVERYLSSRIGEGLIYDLRVKLFDHVQRMPLAFFTRTQTGTLISRLNNDVIGAQRAFTGTLGTVVGNVIALTGTLIAMLLLEWKLTVLAIVILPFFVLPARRVGAGLSDITREGMNVNASMNNTMTERFNVAGALLVKLFGRHRAEADDFSERAGRVRDIGVRSAMYSRVFLTALTLVGAIGTALVYWWGGHQVIDGDITPGTLVALGLYTVRIYMPLTSLSNARVDVMQAFVSFERVFEVLDTPNVIQDADDAVELPRPARGEIHFRDVTFRYPHPAEGTPVSLGGAEQTGSPDDVLRGLNVGIAPGQMIAIVGPSGSGKTTMTSLVPRLYDVTSGSITIDGHDIRSVTQDSLRQTIGVVSQDPHLFHESVGANLRYARPGATDAELVEACRVARIHNVIAELPDGYDTVVGERGYRLSGGEKQRLAIARMLLKDPAVVILDEATSHLDTENEAHVQEALASALEGRTSIVIAHRLSTITDADQILVLDNGRIVERGTHEELRHSGGLYKELYETLVRAEVG